MTHQTSVLYNAQCPVCNFEISHYAAYSDTNGLPIKFHDLNGPALTQLDLTEDQAARRLYVLHDGALLSGMPAFFALWRLMPRYTWLATLLDRAVLRPITSFTYDHILAPLIYKWHLRRKRRNVTAKDRQN